MAGAVAVAALLVITATACGNSNDDASDGGTLNVFAAASLTDAFTALASEFEADHPDVDVVLNFAASSALAEQIRLGAPADVFASADEISMAKLTAAGEATNPRVFGRNRLSIIVEPGNPKAIRSLRDLADEDVIVAVCAREAPCGRYAAATLAQAGVNLTPATREGNVRAVVAKVTLGEVDAGIVYATDVRAAGHRVEGVTIDISDDPELEPAYPIAATTRGARNQAATAWIELVRSDRGSRVLERFGFLAP